MLSTTQFPGPLQRLLKMQCDWPIMDPCGVLIVYCLATRCMVGSCLLCSREKNLRIKASQKGCIWGISNENAFKVSSLYREKLSQATQIIEKTLQIKIKEFHQFISDYVELGQVRRWNHALQHQCCKVRCSWNWLWERSGVPEPYDVDWKNQL